MRATYKKGPSTSNIEVEPWIKEELTVIELESKKKRIANIRELNLVKIEQKTELEVLKQGSELQKLKREMKIGNTGESDAFGKSLATDPVMQEKWLSYTDQQRAVIMAGLQQSKALGGDSSMAQAMMLAQISSKPTSTLKDMLEVAQMISKTKGEGNEGKNMLEAIRLGFEMSQKKKPEGTSTGNIFKETMNFLKPFYDTLSNKDKELYKQQFDVLRNQIQPLSQQLKDAGEVASLLGYQKGTGSQLETQMAIKKMEMEHQRFMAEQGWKHEEWRDKVLFDRENAAKRLEHDRETEKNRWDTILTIGTKWMDKASPILDAGIGGAVKRISGNPTEAATPTTPQQINLSCVKCGTPIAIIGDPESVNCPNCGLVHNKNVLT